MSGAARRTATGMRGMRIVVVSVALMVAGACSGGDDEPPVGPTVPPGGTSSTTSTTTPAPSTTLSPADYAVPEVIDQAYVQRVVSAFDKVLGDAIRVLKRDGGLSEDFLKHLLAIYTAPEFEGQQTSWQDALRLGDLQKRPPVPQDPITAVVRVARADSKCITAEVDRDMRPTLSPGVEPAESEQPDYVVLVRKQSGRDPLGLNPTPWVMAFDGFKIDGSEPINSCDD